MKKNIVYLMLASLLLFTGCANYLDQDPEDLNSMDKIFSSKIETTKWYNRIYSDDFMVQEMHYSGQIPYFWCTDESAYILESHVRNIAEGKMSPDNYYGYTGSYNLYFFVRYYQAIRHCNLFLENVDKCAELGEIDRRTMRAEARFMRAYYHYLLLRLYGPIPIVETSRSADQIGASQARNTLGECVRWINGEIDWACENGMPAARDEKFTLGLPTIGAARAIQSRMLLMVASPLFNGNSAYKNWTNHDGTVLMPQTYDKELWKDAADAAKTVIDMTEYQLLKPAADATFDEIVDNLRAVTTTCAAGKNNKLGSVGIPMVNTIIAAFEPGTDRELPIGERGELCISGPTTMKGYYNKADETAMILRRHPDGRIWVHTGDIGYLDEDGFVYLDSRIKRLIIRHDGFKVFPSMIENVVSRHPAVHQCSVVGCTDKDHVQGRLPFVYIVLKADTTAKKKQVIRELERMCAEELPEYVQPVAYKFISSMPMTPVGKVDYRQLEADISPRDY